MSPSPFSYAVVLSSCIIPDFYTAPVVPDTPPIRLRDTTPMSMAHRRRDWAQRARHPRTAHTDPPWDTFPPPFTSCPSHRMDKTLEEERKHEWQSTPADVRHPSFCGTCIENTCCLCVVYARASTRLERALEGQDATNLGGVIPYFNAHCLQFCLCIPFYGLFISNVQSTVRAYYGIDGNDCKDVADGLCCPCCTLNRSDEEIYRREMQEKNLTNLDNLIKTAPGTTCGSISEYKPHRPMVHTLSDCPPSTIMSPPKIKSPSSHKETEDGRFGLTPIPELSHEVSNVPGVTEGPSPPVSPDTAAKGKHWADISKRTLAQLSRFWHDQAADKKENDKPKSEDGLSGEKPVDRQKRHSLDNHDRSATPGVPQPVTHGLEEHAKVAADLSRSRFKEHLLKDDKPTHLPPKLGSSHTLATDPVLSPVKVPSSHHLESDKQASSQPSKGAGHELTVDSTTPSARSPAAHDLDLDPLESTKPKGLWPSSARHDLHVDQVAKQPATLSHTLREDVSGDPIKANAPHRLEADKVQKNIPSTSPGVESDAKIGVKVTGGTSAGKKD